MSHRKLIDAAEQEIAHYERTYIPGLRKRLGDYRRLQEQARAQTPPDIATANNLGAMIDATLDAIALAEASVRTNKAMIADLRRRS